MGSPAEQHVAPFVAYALLVLAVLASALAAGWLLGRRGPARGATAEPFESGIVPAADSEAEDVRLSVDFYLIAMFFVIFDLETIWLFAWAVAFRELGWAGYAGAAGFVLVLLAALVYELRTGALDWGPRIAPGARRPSAPPRGATSGPTP